MSKLVAVLFAVIIGIGALVADADAARLGGGRSFGMNRSSAPVNQAAPHTPSAPAANPANAANAASPAAAAKPAPAATPQPSGASRWLGPLAGLAAGIGLASLLSHFGLGEGFANILMLGLLVMAGVFLFRKFFGKAAPQPAYAGNTGSNGNIGNVGNAGVKAAPINFSPAGATTAGSSMPATAPVPAGFDAAGFVREAKLNFIRLQAANDAGNLSDLKHFTSPEVFAEVKMQIEERGTAKQETDVQHLDAELLELVTEGDTYIASVRFSGQIRENVDPVQPFAEIWHLTRPVSSQGGWLIAGIQQIS